MELLVTVENHFRIKDMGVVILPALNYPKSGIRPFSEQVVIRHPDGGDISLDASFVVSIPIGGAGNTDIVVLFREVPIELIPIGSEIFVTPELLFYLQGELERDQNNIINWLEPWSPINDTDTCLQLENELYRETGKEHVLSKRINKAIGRRRDRDDVLFKVGFQTQMAVVHLTFSSKPEPLAFPTITLYNDIAEFIEKQMKPDHAEFLAIG